MSLRNHLINFFKGNVSLKDIWYYIQGNYRHKLFYSRFKFLIRKYIREQIALRILVMNEECYNNVSGRLVKRVWIKEPLVFGYSKEKSFYNINKEKYANRK